MFDRQSVYLYLLLAIMLEGLHLGAQQPSLKREIPWLDSIVVYAGNNAFSSNTDWVTFAKKQQLKFIYTLNDQVLRGELFVKDQNEIPLRITESGDFDVLDSLRLVGTNKYVFRIRFKNISLSEFSALYIETETGKIYEIPLIPVCKVDANFYPPTDDVFVGESRKYEIITNNVDNLVLDRQWRSTDAFDYRLVKIDNAAFIYIEPKKAGEQTFEFAIETRRPVWVDSNIQSHSATIQKKFLVKNTRFTFLRFDERQIIRNPSKVTTVEVSIENHRLLQLGKVYRIEASEEPESPLVAELITLRRSSNDKIIAELRPYNTHLASSGSVYIKDGTRLLFLSNIEIIPTPTVEKALVMRNGGEWTESLSLRPGDEFSLRIEGRFLRNSTFRFGELQVLRVDTQNRNDVVRLFQLRVPADINVRKVPVMLGQEPTSIEINIAEHQTPRPLDFIYINYGDGSELIENINQPVLYPHTINDVVLAFDRSKIDEGQRLYGKQHIRVRVRMEDKNGILIENTVLGSFIICPDESSPRYTFYTKSGCRLEEIRVNDFMTRKTHVVSEWGKIEVFIEHVSSNYTTEGYTKRITIYHRKRTSFDVDVSVPAGLFVQKLGKNEPIASLTGISFAMIAQFSFYRKDEIQKLLPIKAGIGFLAQNAFNFNPNAERDLGIIALISVYPIRGTNRISFPLYGGGGYFLQENKFFALIGPGIRISF